MKPSIRNTSTLCLMISVLAGCSSEPVGPGNARGKGFQPRAGSGALAPGAATSGTTEDVAGETPGLAKVPTSNPKGDGLKPGDCAGKDISTVRVTPTVWLVVDGSGSMVDALSPTDMRPRWVAIREALMDPAMGVVKALEHDVKWGFVVYDGKLGGGGPRTLILPDGGTITTQSADVCPRIISVEPKRDNYADIEKVFTPDPLGGSTPTDKALESVISHLPNGGMPTLDEQAHPTIVVLATDGEPNDLCGDGPGGIFGDPDVKPRVINAVQRLKEVNIKTYVVSLAGEDMNLTTHLIDVARTGGTGKAPFIPQNQAQLIQTFRDIIGPGAACEFTLTGKVKPGLECMGALDINGTPLACNSDNGWRLKDTSTIEITGTACQMYKANPVAVLHAEFPCEVQVLN